MSEPVTSESVMSEPVVPEPVAAPARPGPACEGMAADLSCGICLDLFCKPVTLTDCGHSFCCMCLLNDVRYRVGHKVKPACCTCRVEITTSPSAVSLTIEKIVEAHLATRPAAEQAEQKVRMQSIHLELFNTLGEEASRGEHIWKWFRHANAIFDATDQIFRCPLCIWELDREGVCTNPPCLRRWEINPSLLPLSPESAYSSSMDESGSDDDEGGGSDSDDSEVIDDHSSDDE